MEQTKRIGDDANKIWTRDFIIMCLVNFIIFFIFQMTLPILPLFIKEIGGSDQIIGIIVGIFMFSALVFRPYAGHALEIKGRKLIYVLGIVIFIFSVGAFSFTTSVLILLLLRIIQGVGWGFFTTASGTIAIDLIPPKRLGEGIGYFGLSSNFALAFGPAIGLTLVGITSFTNIFLICGVLGLVAIYLSTKIGYKKVVEPPSKPNKARFDFFEKTAIEPSIVVFFITFTHGGIAAFLPLHTMDKGIPGIEFYFVTYAIFIMLSRTFIGRIYDRTGHRFIFSPGAFLILVAMLLLAWLPNTFVMLIAGGLYGLGFGALQPTLQAWAVEKTPNNRKGMANATFYSSFDLGIGMGSIALGQIAYLFGYGFIYLTAAGSIVISFLYYLYIVRKARKSVKEKEVVL